MSVNEAAIDLSTRGTLPASWGWSEPLDLAPTHELRRLVVSPYAAIDALCRTDQDVHWVIVCGEATVVLGTAEHDLDTGDAVCIPRGVRHAVRNQRADAVVMIETRIW
ncbi:MAG: cupin domain-containing protein [Acidimicrobiales bacterium]|nr:cupin domain-containing protein [Acidimicrobiales bacterium]